MKLLKLAIVLSMLFMSAVASSADLLRNGFYFGLKAGSLLIDEGDDSAGMFGLQAGVGIDQILSLEFNYTSGESNAVDISNTALYAVYRTKGQGYFIGKLGFLKEELGDESNSGVSYGFGGGFKVYKEFDLEAEYTFAGDDTKLLAVTGRMRF